MTIDNLRSFLAIPLAAAFLILVLCLFARERPPAMGLRAAVPRVRIFPFADCYDDRPIWMTLSKDGSIHINETPISGKELKRTLSKIYDGRGEPNAIFMRVDPEVPYGDFVDVYNEVSSVDQNLHVGLMTDGLIRLLKECPVGASCGLDWPDHKYIPWCLSFNNLPVGHLRSPVRSH